MLVLFGVMVSYLNPLVNLLEAWQGSKSSESQLAQLKQERVELSGQLRAASSPATLEREARRLGMVKPGEHAYVVHGLAATDLRLSDIREGARKRNPISSGARI